MTSKLTREQLHERARENIKALKLASRQTAFESAREEILADLQLAELALAAMDSEPVAWTDEEELRDVNVAGIGYLFGIDREANKFSDPRRQIMLYRHALPASEYPEVLPCPVLLEPGMRFGKGVKTRLVLEAIQRRAEHHAELEAMAPEERAEYDANIEAFKAMLPLPAPVVPDAATAIRACLSEFPESARDIVEECADIAENACRAAMLHAGNSLAQSDCCPEQNCIHSAQGVDRPVAWHHSAKSKEGNHGTCCFSYASSHDFGPRYEKPQSQPHYLPERLDYDRALHFLSTEPRKVTPETVMGGNSPVIPDGYVMVPKQPTERMVIDGFESEPDETFSEPEVWEAFQKMSGCEQAAYRARLCWAAMLAAAPPAPKQENI